MEKELERLSGCVQGRQLQYVDEKFHHQKLTSSRLKDTGSGEDRKFSHPANGSVR